jgi:DNA-binding PadR family transcriptional regulator
MSTLSGRVLQVFKDMRKDRLDLHVLFEAAGNDPAKRNEVLDAIDDLVREGLIEEQGSDFYGLTGKGKQAIAESRRIPES